MFVNFTSTMMFLKIENRRGKIRSKVLWSSLQAIAVHSKTFLNIYSLNQINSIALCIMSRHNSSELLFPEYDYNQLDTVDKISH